MMPTIPRSVFCLVRSLPTFAAYADVTLRPGDKPKESTKDFIKDKDKNGYLSPEPRDRTFAYVTGLSVEVELECGNVLPGASEIHDPRPAAAPHSFGYPVASERRVEQGAGNLHQRGTRHQIVEPVHLPGQDRRGRRLGAPAPSA